MLITCLQIKYYNIFYKKVKFDNEILICNNVYASKSEGDKFTPAFLSPFLICFFFHNTVKFAYARVGRYANKK
jgi:hypothetical protein